MLDPDWFICLVLLLKDFDFKVKYQKGKASKIADHLSRLEEETIQKLEDNLKIDDAFPDEQVLAAYQDWIPWFSNFYIYWENDLLSQKIYPSRSDKDLCTS